MSGAMQVVLVGIVLLYVLLITFAFGEVHRLVAKAMARSLVVKNKPASRRSSVTEQDVLCALLKNGALTRQGLYREIAKAKGWNWLDRFLLGYNAINPIIHQMTQRKQSEWLITKTYKPWRTKFGMTITRELWFLTRPLGYTAAQLADCPTQTKPRRLTPATD